MFEVSINKVHTFEGFVRSGSGRWVVHDIINQKPLAEFLGPGQEEISFSIRLDINMGVSPEVELQRLREIRDTGKVSELIIGGKLVTKNLWLLESMSEQQKVFSGAGKLVVASVNLTLKEYPRVPEAGGVVSG